MTALRVLHPGLLATVQDLGREGWSHVGVPPSGAADALSLRVGNRLVGNADGAPALELTLTGGAYAIEVPALIALAGAPMPAVLVDRDGHERAVPPWRAGLARGGDVLRIGSAPWGVRTYLCVAGGIDVPRALGSASTHLASGLGGLVGRALRPGDRLDVVEAPHTIAPRALDAASVERVEADLRRPRLRAVAGAQASRFPPEGRAAFWRAPFLVTDRSDRMGVRLEGPDLSPPGGGSMVTEGVPSGAVQVPGPGQAIVLLADRPPTGGYPVVACVIEADHARLGQLRPHELVAFEEVSLEEARAARRERERWLDAAAPRPASS